jgi:hypothetical protein
MGLTDRNAPNDTPLERGIASENIDVSKPGRFYPEDFSGQIQAVQQKQSLLSEIPKSLAHIVEHTNDYKINMWSEEQDRAIFSQAQRNELYQKELEQKLVFDTKNAVTDKYMQMKDDAYKRLIEADKNNADFTPVAQELYQEYENPAEFEGNWEAQKLWRETLKHDQSEVLPKLWDEDLKKAKWISQKNMSDLMNSQYSLVRSGQVQPFDAMNSILSKLIIQGEDLNSRELQTSLNTVFNSLVPAYAEYIVDMQKKGLYSNEKAYEALADLQETCSSAWFDCIGVDGKRLMNPDGSIMQLNLVLSAEAQNKLYHVFSASKGASGSADALLDGLANDYKRDVGWDPLQKFGSSNKLSRFNTAADVTVEFENLIARIGASPATDAKKAKVVRELMPVFAAAYNTTLIRDISKQAKGKTGEILQGFVKQLESDINTGKVTASYNLVGTTEDGQEYNLFYLPIDAANPALGNTEAAARLYWDSTLEVLRKQSDIINNQGGAKFLHHFEYEYGKQEEDLINSIQASTLLARRSPDDTTPTAIEQGVALLHGLQSTANKYGFHSQRVTTDLLKNMIQQAQDPNKGFDTPEKKIQALFAISEMFTTAGEAGVITRYMNQNLSDETAQILYLAQALGGLKETDNDFAQGMISYLTTAKNDPKERESIKHILQNENFGGDTRKNEINRIYEKYKIPSAHIADGRINVLKQHAYEYSAYTTGKLDMGDDYLKKMLNQLYVLPPKNSGLKESIYRYSPQYLPYVTENKEQEFSDIVTQASQGIQKQFKDKKLPDLAKKVQIISDDEAEVFRWKIGDKDVEIYDVQKGKYIPPVLPDPSFLDTYKPSVAAKVTTANVVASYLANDEEEYQKYLELTGKVDMDEKSKFDFSRKIQAISTTINDSIQSVADRLESPISTWQQAIDNLDTQLSERASAKAQSSPIWMDAAESRMFGEVTGQAANIELDSIASLALADSSYVGKIKQSDISEPIVHAAAGNEGYIDVYNTCSSLGYKIDSTYIPGVTMEYSGPTGFAASWDATSSRTQVPTATGKTYSKQEIFGMVDYYADMFGISRNLARALVNQESGGQQHVKSHAGAIGVMQLMPATAKGLGVTNPEDAAQNIWGGMKYLHSMLKQFNGNVPLALAAYNAGPGAVQKAKGIPNYPETKAYVKNICSKAGIAVDGKQYPVNISMASNKAKFIDPDTNMLNPASVNNLVQAVNNASCFKDKVVSISTNRPELLEAKPEYADFAQYRQARTTNGKPLFVKGDVDGFSINLSKEGKTQLDPAAITALAEDAARTQTKMISQIGSKKIEALLATVAPRYEQLTGNTFGLAGLSTDEYEEYGVPISAMNNPVLQARVLTQEFQRATDILGNERKAIYALVGGQMADDKGEIKTWSEIKQDKENFTKNWFISPTLDDKKRSEVNALVSMYNTICSRNRGL